MRTHSSWRPSGLLVLAAVAALLSSGPGWSGARADSLAGGADEWLDVYVRSAEAIRRQALRPDLCPYDPAAVVLTVGRDPEALVRFVRERIAYEPQAGSVRGPAGTLAAGAGGDWDRAALLQALLTEAGYRGRYRVIERTDAERAAVVDAFLAQQGRARLVFARPDEAVAPPPPSALLEQSGVSPRNRDILAAQSLARWQRLIDEAYDAAAVEAPWLADALRTDNAAPLGRPFDAWREPLLEAAGERVVVELFGGQVLDASPDADPLPVPRVRQGRAFREVPPSRVARLTIRLWMVVTGPDAPDGPTLLLERPLSLGALLDQPIRLEIVPVDAQAAQQPATVWSPEQWHEYVTNFDRFQAVLLVGSAWETSKVFDRAGVLHEVSADGRIESAQQMGAGVQQGFGGLFGGGGAQADAPPATRLDSLVMELELALPGQEPQRQQRLLVSPLREGVSPVYQADMLVAAGPIGPASMAWLMVRALADNAPVLAELAGGDDPARFAQAPPVTRMPRMLHEWQLGRYALAERLLTDAAPLTPLAGPTLAMWTTQLIVDDQARQVTGRTALDVVWDGLVLWPREPQAGDLAFERNVRLGVASTALESLVLRELRPPALMRSALAEAQLFQLRGTPPVVRRAQDADTAQPAPLAAWAIARNEADRLLVLPRPDGAESWWSLDPATGATIGRGDAGEGQATIEYLKITKMNLDNLKCFLEFQAGYLQGKGSSAATGWMQCVTGANATGAMGAAGGSMQLSAGLGAQGELLGLLADALTIMQAIEEHGKGK